MCKKVKVFLASLFATLAFSCANASALSVVSLEKVSADTDSIELSDPADGYDFDANFLDKNQTLQFKATIENTDASSVKLGEITLNSSEHDFLEYSYSGIESGETIPGNSLKSFIITVKTNDNEPSTVTEDYNLDISYESVIPDNPPTFSEAIVPLVIVLSIAAAVALFVVFTNSHRRYFVFFLVLPLAGALLLLNSQTNAATIQQLGIKGKISYTKIYTVTVDPNGGIYQESAEPTIKQLREGQKYHIDEATRDGFSFASWEINPNTLTPDENNDIEIHSDTKLKALWDEVYYTLTIKPNGGKYNGVETDYTESFRPHETATIETPEKTGYDFIGWTNQDNESWTGDSIQMEKDITLTANYEIKHLRVTVNPNGGKYKDSTETYSATVDYGTVIDLTDVSYTDHEIKNWTKNESTTLPAETQNITITEDTDLVANWWSSIFHTVTIIPNGGIYDGKAETSTYQVREGTKYDLLEATRADWLFDYWHYTGTETTFEGEQILVDGDISLTAEWAPIIARIERTGKLYSSIMKAEAEAITDDTITLLVDTEEIVTNTKKVTLDLYTHTVTGYIINTATGHLTLINGEVNNYNSAIIDTQNPNGAAVVNKGTLIMGVNDYRDAAMNEKEPLIDNENIRLIGSEIGLDQDGAFYFYDGFIEGIIGLNGGYDGSPWYRQTFDGVVVNYFPFVTHNVTKDCQHVELSNADKAVSKTIEKGAIYYYNLQDNINTSARTGYKIYAVRDFDASYAISVPENVKIVFDIIGYEVNLGDNVTIDGELKIIDSAEEKGLLTSSKTIQDNSELSLEDIEVYALTTNTLMQLNGNLNMKNSTLHADKGTTLNTANAEVALNLDANSKIISETTNPAINNNSPSLILTNGTIQGQQCTVYNNSGRTFTLSNGTIKGVTSAVCNYGGTFTMNSGTVTTERSGVTYAIYTPWNYGGTININGGLVRATQTSNSNPDTYGIYSDTGNGSINITGGSIEAIRQIAGTGGYVFAIDADNTVNITGGHIKASNTSTGDVYGIRNSYYGNVTIDGSNVLIEAYGTNSRAAYGVAKRYSTLNFKNGTIKAEANTGVARGMYVSPYDSTTLNMSGGTVIAHSVENNAWGIFGVEDTSYKNDTVNMSGGSVSAISDASDKTGVGLASNTLSVTGGTVYGNTYGIKGDNHSVANITLGKNEDPLYNGINTDDEGNVYPATPEIKGGVYGITGGNVYFYDGIIKGGTTYINNPDNVKAIPDGTSRVVTDLTDPVEQDCWLEYDEDYLQLPDGNTYNSLTGAYKNVKDGETITVIRDASTPAVLPTNTKNITIDLNGHLLSYTQPLGNDGTMVITDSSTSKTGSIANNSSVVDRTINNNGTLSIEAGTITGTTCTVYNNSGRTFTLSNGTIKGVTSAVCNYGGTFTMNSGTVTTERSGVTYAIYTPWNYGGTININGGLVRATQTSNSNPDTYGIYSDTGNGSINITGGSIEAIRQIAGTGGYVFAIDADNTVNITGGHIKASNTSTGDVYGIRNSYYGNVTIDGSNVLIEAYGTNSRAAYGVAKRYSTLNFKNGTIKAEANTGVARGMYVSPYDSTTLNMSGGTVIAHSVENNAWGIFGVEDTSYKNDTVNMSGGSVSAISDASDKTGVGLASNTLSVTGGTVYGNTYGIKGDNHSVANITLGKNEDPLYNGINTDDEGNVYPATPEIKGGVYGITGGNVYFYDGIIKGGTTAYYDRNIKKIANNTYMHGRTETIDGTEYDVKYLANEEVLAKIGNNEYYSIQAAADAAKDGDEIDLVADNYIFHTLTFPAGKKITLDLNGYEIIDGNQIINNGDVTIYDSTGAPHLLDYHEANYFIVNEANAKLRITGVDIKSRFAIYNKANGEVALNDLKIGETSKSETAIENYGTLSLNYATIYATYRTIYSSGGALNISNSTLDITNTGDKYTLYTVGSQLNISDSTIIADSVGASNNSYAVYNDRSTGTISNTSIKEDSHGHWYDGYYYHTAYYQSNAAADVSSTDSTIDGYVRIAAGTFTFTDGTLTKSTINNYDHPIVQNGGNTTITNASITSSQTGTSYGDAYASVITNTGTLALNNCTLSHHLDYDAYHAASRIINNTGTLSISDTTMGQTYGSPHYNNTIDAVYGIYNTGTVDYANSTMTINRVTAYGIYAESGTVNVKSGSILTNGTTNAFGLWVKNGTITLGEAEAINSPNYGTANAVVSTTSPLIQAFGATNGIGITLEAGNFNFYDGKIIQTDTIGPAVQADHTSKATITNVEYLYQPEAHTDEEGYNYFILEFMR